MRDIRPQLKTEIAALEKEVAEKQAIIETKKREYNEVEMSLPICFAVKWDGMDILYPPCTAYRRKIDAWQVQHCSNYVGAHTTLIEISMEEAEKQGLEII